MRQLKVKMRVTPKNSEFVLKESDLYPGDMEKIGYFLRFVKKSDKPARGISINNGPMWLTFYE